MRIIAVTGAALLASTALVNAGGVERSTQSVALLFEEGSYAEFSFARVNPEVSGVSQIPVGPSPAGSLSGNISPSYTTLSFGYRQDLSDNLSMALIYDNHIGADVNYAPGTTYLYNLGAGSQADLDGNALTALLRYEFPSNFSVYGGARVSQISGTVSLFNGYTMTTDTSTALGWVLGAAYERPDIALRVALTYNSAIEHDIDAVEGGIAPATATTFQTTLPASWNLEFQTGIAEDTLLFGSIRHVDWPAFDITPTVYTTLVSPGNALVDYSDPYTTYTIGVGRRFNESWSGSVTYVYEGAVGGFSGNLGPTDGRRGIGLGLRYDTGSGMSISGGVQYSWIGDAVTAAPAPVPPGTPYGVFADNTSVAAGLRIGFRF